jgi:phage anti-repressor protein
MGTDFAKIANKLVDNLPSPSGGSNPSFFNTKMETYGLKEDFYYFVIRHTNDNTVAFVKNSFDAKINSVKGQKVMLYPKAH